MKNEKLKKAMIMRLIGLVMLRVFRRVYDRGPRVSLEKRREGCGSERSDQSAGVLPEERLGNCLLAEYQQHGYTTNRFIWSKITAS